MDYFDIIAVSELCRGSQSAHKNLFNPGEQITMHLVPNCPEIYG